jgi:hypothetical protein
MSSTKKRVKTEAVKQPRGKQSKATTPALTAHSAQGIVDMLVKKRLEFTAAIEAMCIVYNLPNPDAVSRPASESNPAPDSTKQV